MLEESSGNADCRMIAGRYYPGNRTRRVEMIVGGVGGIAAHDNRKMQLQASSRG